MDIAFASPKGGVGKTTMAVHVATRLRQLGHDVALIDLDGRSASTSWVGDSTYFPTFGYEVLDQGLPPNPVRVWDTPANPSVDMRQALAQLADLLVIVCQPDKESQRAAIDLYQALEPQEARMRVLFNAFPPTSREGHSSRDALAEAGIPCCETVVRAYKCYQRAQWDDRTIADYPYPSSDQAWSDISALVDEVLEATDGQDR
jgi:chromosome partitioning protein